MPGEKQRIEEQITEAKELVDREVRENMRQTQTSHRTGPEQVDGARKETDDEVAERGSITVSPSTANITESIVPMAEVSTDTKPQPSDMKIEASSPGKDLQKDSMDEGGDDTVEGQDSVIY